MKSHILKNKKLIYGILGTTWLLITFIGYYYTHKPFSSEEVFNGIMVVWRVAIALIIFSLAGGVGFRILGGSPDQTLSLTTIQAALGLGIVSTVTLLLGMWVGLLPWLFAAIITLSLLFLHQSIYEWWHTWYHLIQAWNQSGKFGKCAALMVLIILGCTLLISLAPPLAFDALTYHLAIPQAYLLEGRITYLPEIIYWGMPELTEMLFTLVMLFGGAETATLLGWGIALLTLVGIFSYTKERLDSQAAWAAVICILAGETFSSSIAWGYVEWSSMLFGISMLISLDQWLVHQSPKSVALAGIMAGMGLATKYTTGILIFAGMTVILSQFKTPSPGTTWKALMLFGISALIVTLPWLGKNYIATGNPFYPLLFSAGAMDQIRLDHFQKAFIPPTWLETIFLPWQATIWGVEKKVGFSASIGPLFLGLSPLAGLYWHKRTHNEKVAIKTTAIVTCTGILIWMIASKYADLLIQSRLYFTIFPSWAVLSGAGFSSFRKLKAFGIRFGRIAAALTLLVFSFTVFEICVKTQRQDPLNVLFQLTTTDDYLTTNLGWYSPAMQAIRRLPSNARILLLWETRSLDCLSRCDPDEIIDRWFHDISRYKTHEGVLSAWKSQGYTHILFHQEGAAYIRKYEVSITPEEWDQLDLLLSELPTRENFGTSYTLYSLDQIP